MPAQTLEDLVALYLEEGDEEAAEEVIRRTRPKLLAVARRIGAPQDAEDAVHTAYLSLLHKRGSAFDAPVMPWLVTAVVRIAYRHKAREQRQGEISRRLARAAHADTPLLAAMQAEEARRLRHSVDRLPPKLRDPVILRYLEGLATREVALLLDVSHAAVKKRLERARTLLRGVLAPWIAYPLLAVPWYLADSVQASSQAMLGGAMKLKTAAIVTSAIVAAGAAGIGVGASWRGGHERRAPDRPEQASDRGRISRLLEELDASRERERALQQLVEARQEPVASRSRGRPEEAEPGGKKAGHDSTAAPSPGPEKVTPALWKVAQRLEVGEAALRAALRAEEAVRSLYASVPAEERRELERAAHRSLRELAALGEEGFLGIVALLRSGHQGIWFDRMIRETWAPGWGWEHHLIAVAEDPSVQAYPRWSALSGLGMADTHEVRRFLLDYVERSQDAGLFMSAAKALGTLGEQEGAPHIEDKLFRTGWDGVRPHLLVALGEMGGSEAERILVEYLRNPKAGHLLYAVSALMRVDPAGGAREAANILDGARRAQLGESERDWLEKFAGRK